ncbi:hypothetical protein ACPOL_2544 [Acidisarcina polymorpha]|uniref:Uncharacterized protein n=1 Tax=Acidisarcina polymorpha TaxID=2211140 RepID=A0A2Z5FZA4_9BACT|nr:hypothetical protein ACPOL_2544 [Acidisarcina polymorpha]
MNPALVKIPDKASPACDFCENLCTFEDQSAEYLDHQIKPLVAEPI